MDETMKLQSEGRKISRWNGKRIIQKLSNAGKIHINLNKVGTESSKSREIQRRFKSIVAATRAMYRAPTVLTIDIEPSKQTIGQRTHEHAPDGKLKRTILQGRASIKYEFQADIPSINTLCCDDNNEIWIGCWNKQPLCRLTCEDNIGLREEHDTNVSDMTLLPSGDILFTKYGDCAIKRLSCKDGKISTFKLLTPFFPEGIHANNKGEIFVTVVDETNFLVTRETTRKVVKLSETGKITKEFEYGEHKLKLFILPYRVTENVNGDICVVNRTGSYLGQIVVLDREGKSKFIYDGNPSLPCNDFIPMGIACDRNGCIIVTDPNDYSIHILDKSGILIQYLVSTVIGIDHPISVTVDRHGLLWVGSLPEGKDRDKAKLYALT